MDIKIGVDVQKPPRSATIIIEDMEVYIPLEDLINLDKEIDRLSNQISNLDGRLNSVKSKLDNKNFVSNGPSEIVEHEKNKRNRYEKELLLLRNNLDSLK